MAILTSITVTTSTDVVNPFSLINQTVVFKATAHFSDAPDAIVTTDPTTNWSSATPAVATISNTGITKGEATTQTISGSTVISATYGGKEGSTILRVGLANYTRIVEEIVQGVKVGETTINAAHNPVSRLTVPNISLFTGGIVFLNANGDSGGPIGYTTVGGHPGDFSKLYIANEQQQDGYWVQLNSSGLATTSFNVNQKNLGVVSSICINADGNQLPAGGNPVLIQIAGEAYVFTTDVTITSGSFLGPDVSGKIKAVTFNPASPTPILGFALENISQTFQNMVLMRIQICGE